MCQKNILFVTSEQGKYPRHHSTSALAKAKRHLRTCSEGLLSAHGVNRILYPTNGSATPGFGLDVFAYLLMDTKVSDEYYYRRYDK